VPGEVGAVSTAWAVFSVIGATVIGGIISTIVAFVIQKRGVTAARKQREEDRAEVRRALGYSLLFKMIKLSSNLENLGKTLQESFNNAKESGFAGQPWQFVQPVVPKSDDIHFSPDEMAMLLSVDDKVFNEIAALDDLHNQTTALFELYGQKRQATLSRFSGSVSGSQVSASLTPDEVAWLMPRAMEMNSLIEMMRVRSIDDAKIAWDVLVKLRDTLDTKLGIKHRLEHRSGTD
jgi:hypothetical protein